MFFLQMYNLLYYITNICEEKWEVTVSPLSVFGCWMGWCSFFFFSWLVAEFAAAVALVVEGVLFEELVAALLKSCFAPVLEPEEGNGGRGKERGAGGERMGGSGEGGEVLLGLKSCLVDLLEVFPA